MSDCLESGHKPDVFTHKIGTYEQPKCSECGKRIFKYAGSTRWMTDHEYRVYITQEIKDGK